MKIKKILLGAVAVCALFFGCKSHPKLQGNTPVMATGTPEVIDYPGKALGTAVPDWVFAVDQGANKKIAKALGLDTKTKIFVVTNKGTDLDFLKTWSDQVDIRAEVASAIEQTVAQSVQAAFDGKDADTQTKERAYSIYSASMTNLTLNGLQKEAHYWIKTRTPKAGVKKARKDTDYDIEYTYYVVFGIEKDSFQEQMEAAIADVEDNTNQSELLKSVLTEKLNETIVVKEGKVTEDNYDYFDNAY